jgi:hypothetical protein
MAPGPPPPREVAPSRPKVPRVRPRRVTLVLGPSGGGKTVLMNVLLMRAIAQGMRGWIIDLLHPRPAWQTAGSGHYDTLLSLVPGSRRVQVGSAAGDVICPWDVGDAQQVPSESTSSCSRGTPSRSGTPTAKTAASAR